MARSEDQFPVLQRGGLGPLVHPSCHAGFTS
jgi:hypothetical protein